MVVLVLEKATPNAFLKFLQCQLWVGSVRSGRNKRSKVEDEDDDDEDDWAA